jgi:opacity protein-like surface antigen
VGYGWQSVKGSSATVSTSANRLSYVTGSVVMTPTTINYTADTAILNIGLNLGLTYSVLDHTSFDLVYSYNRSEYQAEYRTAQRSDILNNLTFNQDNHSMKFAINYRF